MPRTFDRARAALQSGDFRFLLVARLVSQFADGLFQAYLIDKLVFLSPEHSTAIGVAKAYAVLVIPFSLVGPATGVVIDRWSRRAILMVTPLFRALAALALIAVTGGRATLALYVLALVVVSLDRFFLATAGAVMPRLVEDQNLLVGNSLNVVTGTVVTFVGLVVGTQVADQVGPRVLLAAAAVAWPATALLVSRIANPLRPETPGGTLRAELGRVVADLGRGARRLAATPAALGPIVSIGVDQFLIGIVTVLSVVVFTQQFKQGVASYGRIVGAGGVGVLVGSLTVGTFERRWPRARIMGFAFALPGVACLIAAPKIVGVTIFMVSFVLGLTYPWRKVPADTLVQESIPDRYRGRVFAIYDLAFSAPRVMAAALLIYLVPHVSSGWIVAVTGLAYLAWTPVPAAWARRRPRVEVRFYAGGAADEVPRSLVIGGEEEAVQVLSSSLLDRGGVRIRSFRLLGTDGSRLEVEGDGGTWTLVRQVPQDIAASEPGPPDQGASTGT